jgi:cobalt-precorrin-5B (C1)-methyltransferase
VKGEELLSPMPMKWRLGYTTGTCAAAAAKAAAIALFFEERPAEVEVELPNSERVQLPVLAVHRVENRAEASVRKHAGDDPDVTDQIRRRVRYSFQSLAIGN